MMKKMDLAWTHIARQALQEWPHGHRGRGRPKNTWKRKRSGEDVDSRKRVEGWRKMEVEVWKIAEDVRNVVCWTSDKTTDALEGAVTLRESLQRRLTMFKHDSVVDFSSLSAPGGPGRATATAVSLSRDRVRGTVVLLNYEDRTSG